MIESYDFGEIVIDGKKYTSDVIIYPERIDANWWRKEGHTLSLEDLTEVLREKPDLIIVGTGQAGVMQIPPETRKQIEARGIEIIAADTRKACDIYNERASSGKVIACLHLTC